MALVLALFPSYLMLRQIKKGILYFYKYIFCFFLCKGTKIITQINTPPHKIVIIFNSASILSKTNMRKYNTLTYTQKQLLISPSEHPLIDTHSIQPRHTVRCEARPNKQ